MEELKRRITAASNGRQKLESWMLAAATPMHILVRMRRNLYAKKRDLAGPFSAVDRALLCQPDASEDLRARGRLCLALGGHKAAKWALSLP